MVRAIFLLRPGTYQNGCIPVCKLGHTHVDADIFQLCGGADPKGMEAGHKKDFCLAHHCTYRACIIICYYDLGINIWATELGITACYTFHIKLILEGYIYTSTTKRYRHEKIHYSSFAQLFCSKWLFY